MAFLTGGLDAEAYDRTYSDAQLVRRIAAYFRPHARTVALVAAMVALGSLAVTAMPFVIARGIDALTGNPSLQILLALAALLTTLGALFWLCNLVRLWYAARAVGAVVLALREDAFRAVMRHDMSFYDQHASGRVVSRVTSDTQDFATVVTLTIDLLSQLVLVGVIMAVMLVVNWQLALITLLIGPLVIAVALVFRRIARRAMRNAQRAQATVNATIQETISGIAVAKNFRQEAAIYADFQETNNLAYRVQIARVAVFGSIFPLLNTLAGLGVAVVVYFGGLLVLGDRVSVGDWYLFVQSLVIFFYPLTSIASFWSQFQQGLAASERVFALIDAEPHVTQVAAVELPALKGEIRFEGVQFSYAESVVRGPLSVAANDRPPTADDGQPTTDDHQTTNERRNTQHATRNTLDGPLTTDNGQLTTDNRWVLHDFSLAIPAGQTLAVVGHTGAGKSSLIKLIMRFYEFQGGRLLIDGHDIRSLDLAQYRRQIGLVPQVPFLFAGSVADNIRYGRPGAGDSDVEAAARHVGDGSWLDDLPQGLRTEVGERGARLSLGQRQLVALARVLFQNPAILLLDEATASIDPFTEAQVQAGLAAALRGRTSIIIAHRLSTVRAADRIIVMRAGQIAEAGSHAELLGAGGHYAELYATYFRHQAYDYQPDEQ